MRNRKRLDLTVKYCDLYGATLMNLIDQAGAQNVVDASILNKAKTIMDSAIKTPNDIIFHHSKLMEMRGA